MIIQEIDIYTFAREGPKSRVQCILSRLEFPWQHSDVIGVSTHGRFS